MHLKSALVTFLVGITVVIAAPPKERTLTLVFIPQGSEDEVSPTLGPAVVTRPLLLTFEDGRPAVEQPMVGEGTDDSDRVFPWRSTNPVPGYAQAVFERVAGSWGVRFDQKAQLLLAIRLVRFYVTEKDQAVGSSYLAEVRVAFELKRSAGGESLAAGVVGGEASRYGRKRSPDNCNEVLSDATRQAYLRLLDNRDLQSAWSGESVPPKPTPQPSPPS